MRMQKREEKKEGKLNDTAFMVMIASVTAVGIALSQEMLLP